MYIYVSMEPHIEKASPCLSPKAICVYIYIYKFYIYIYIYVYDKLLIFCAL